MANCIDCGKKYSTMGCDLVLPDQQWKVICPEDGILCASCICQRAGRLGGTVVLAWVNSIDYAAHDAAAGDKAVAYQCNDPLCDCWGDTPFRHCPGCNELYLWSKNEPTTPCLDCQSHAAAGDGSREATNEP